MLQAEGYLPIGELSARLSVSEATLRRDLAELERTRRITRTRGGALMDQHPRFPTFAQRRKEAWEEKQRIAVKARELFESGFICFFDAGTTVAAIAQKLVEEPVEGLRVVTPSLPVAEILAEAPGIDVLIPGGQLLPRQSVLLGDLTEQALKQWDFDLSFFGIQGFDEEGLWNTQEPVVRVQKVAARQSRQSIYCADAGKCGADGPVFLARWTRSVHLLTSATPQKITRLGLDQTHAHLIYA